MNHEKGHRGIGHNPEPLEYTLFTEGRLINVIDFGLPGDLAKALIVRFDSR